MLNPHQITPSITPSHSLGQFSLWLAGVTLLLFGAFPVLAQAQFITTTNNSQVTITGYTGSGGAVNIPSTLGGLPVTAIGDDAFARCQSLTSIAIPKTVSSIGCSAFDGCSSLTSVTIPTSVTEIKDAAFWNCHNLTSAIFQGNAPDMYSDVFSYTANGFTVYYYNNATGFTSPTWTGDKWTAVNLGSADAERSSSSPDVTATANNTTHPDAATTASASSVSATNNPLPDTTAQLDTGVNSATQPQSESVISGAVQLGSTLNQCIEKWGQPVDSGWDLGHTPCYYFRCHGWLFSVIIMNEVVAAESSEHIDKSPLTSDEINSELLNYSSANWKQVAPNGWKTDDGTEADYFGAMHQLIVESAAYSDYQEYIWGEMKRSEELPVFPR